MISATIANSFWCCIAAGWILVLPTACAPVTKERPVQIADEAQPDAEAKFMVNFYWSALWEDRAKEKVPKPERLDPAQVAEKLNGSYKYSYTSTLFDKKISDGLAITYPSFRWTSNRERGTLQLTDDRMLMLDEDKTVVFMIYRAKGSWYLGILDSEERGVLLHPVDSED